MPALLDTSIKSKVTEAVAAKVERIDRKRIARQRAEFSIDSQPAVVAAKKALEAAQKKYDDCEFKKAERALAEANKNYREALWAAEHEFNTLGVQLKLDIQHDTHLEPLFVQIRQAIAEELAGHNSLKRAEQLRTLEKRLHVIELEPNPEATLKAIAAELRLPIKAKTKDNVSND